MSYISYNSVIDRNNLDLNTFNGNNSVIFPNNIYEGELNPLSQYVCESGPRDTRYDYLYNLERMSHPDHPSRFGYAECWNGYCSGHWPGRYNSSPVCREQDTTQDQPPNMAPSRFYKEDKFTSPFYSDSPAYTVSRISRQLR